MMQKLFNKLFKEGAVGGASIDAVEENSILVVCRQDLISLTSMKLVNLDGCHPS